MVCGTLPGRVLHPFRWFIGFAVLLCAGALAFGQEKTRQPLEFEVDQGKWALRSEAPVPLRLKVTCSSADILEGDLEIQIGNNTGEIIASIKIPDLVYSPGRQEVEYLLPIQSHRINTRMDVNCIFRGKNGAFYVSQGLLIPPQRRSFVVPIVRSGQATEGSDDFAWLMLEGRCPKHSLDAAFAPMLTQAPVIEAADLPRDPLKHMAHDIVVIEASGLAGIVGPQVQALEAWVRGGGSLFLQIGSQDLSTEQQEFVDRLVAANPNVLSDEVEGTQLIPIIAGGKYAMIEYGFGHVLLTTSRSWAGTEEADHREVCGFLWRLRQVQLDSLRQSGKLTLSLAQQQMSSQWSGYNSAPNAYSGYGNGQNPYTVQSNGQISFGDDAFLSDWQQQLSNPRSNRPNEMIEALMPRDVQAVPIWLLSTIILAYIAAIGFGDYIVLGKIKRRRWTWFTFPAMTLAVSLLSIGTAKGYLSSSQDLNTVEYCDVTEDGTIARVQRFELHFRSSPGRQITLLDQAVFTPVASQTVNNSNGNYNRSPESITTDMIAIEGVPTQQAKATQPLDQWRPQLNRTVSFPRNRQSPIVLVPPKSGESLLSPAFRADVQAQILKAFPNATSPQVFIETDQVFMANEAALNTHVVPNQLDQDFNSTLKMMSNCLRPKDTGQQAPLGVFTLFNQISPSADTGLVDMVIATPGHQVLCVAVREPTGSLTIYRWRMRVNP